MMMSTHVSVIILTFASISGNPSSSVCFKLQTPVRSDMSSFKCQLCWVTDHCVGWLTTVFGDWPLCWVTDHCVGWLTTVLGDLPLCWVTDHCVGWLTTAAYNLTVSSHGFLFTYSFSFLKTDTSGNTIILLMQQ